MQRPVVRQTRDLAAGEAPPASAAPQTTRQKPTLHLEHRRRHEEMTVMKMKEVQAAPSVGQEEEVWPERSGSEPLNGHVGFYHQNS